MNYPEDIKKKKARIKELQEKINELFNWFQEHEITHQNWDANMRNYKEHSNEMGLIIDSLSEGSTKTKTFQKEHKEKVLI